MARFCLRRPCRGLSSLRSQSSFTRNLCYKLCRRRHLCSPPHRPILPPHYQFSPRHHELLTSHPTTSTALPLPSQPQVSGHPRDSTRPPTLHSLRTLAPRRLAPHLSRSRSPLGRIPTMSISTQTYTPTEEAEIQQWLTTADRLKAASDAASRSPILDTLNAHLSSRATLLGTKPSKADVAVYETLAPLVASWSADERSGEAGRPHIVRHVDFVQNSPRFGLSVADADKVAVDADDVRHVKKPVDAKAEKERLKKEKAAAAAAAAAGATGAAAGTAAGAVEAAAGAAGAAAGKVLPDRTAKGAAGAPEGKKKEKKEKAPKQPKAAPAAAPLSPALIDLRVGHILKAVNHPDADSLYVSTIAMGDPAGDDTTEYEGQVCRTVCSGLNGLVPLEEMQGRKVVVVCNLKPVKMRGIKSSAMVLAASPRLAEGQADDHKGPVELVTPPEGAKAGERVFFQGWAGEPERQLNPKKKVWETIQPGFTTTDDLEVAFDSAVVEQLETKDRGKLVTESGGVCTVKSLKGGLVR